MKKIVLLTTLALASCKWIYAQSVTPDVIASAGDFYSNAQGSVSWTLGEPVGETYTGPNNILTQGFQQPWDFGTSIASSQTPVNAHAFPNPTVGDVTLQFGAASGGIYVIEVFNTLGQQLSTAQFASSPSARTTVSLANHANGIYFITVRKADGTESSTFKINKNA
jgi:hypothetical protein